MRCLSFAAFVAILTTSLPALAKRPVVQVEGATREAHQVPWHARVRIPHRGVVHGFALRDPSIMPDEPSAPEGTLDGKRLTDALLTVCDGKLKPKRAKRYAGWIARYARHFDVDPFVLGALMRSQSGCAEGTPKRALGAGLLRLRYAIHAPFLHDGSYHYWIRDGRAWRPKRLATGRFVFTPRTLRKPEVNIYFGAAILAVYTDQAPDLDKTFPQVRHRHPVAHMIWGDRVRGTASEERVLRDRRRMLFYYTGEMPPPKGRFHGMALRSPLDGAPRKITSGFYNRRGYRRHSAFDYYSQTGEPVRAIADGRVYFAGYQRHRGRARAVAPKHSRRVPRSRMGIGGLFVLVRHKHHLESRYFHLHDFTVRNGQTVKAGDLIGHVGRTGIKHSAPHLHFELRRGHHKINPAPIMRGEALPLRATYWGKHISGRRFQWTPSLARRHRRMLRQRRRARQARRLKARTQARRLKARTQAHRPSKASRPKALSKKARKTRASARRR
ncbi:MAG: M23 family metallopeptidase [Deltaproteobacteria bacterium]|nr:M23 family metallopeptidase [Deltaproteobacteria bacterium]